MSKDEQIAENKILIARKDERIGQLEFENAQLKKLIFGAKSEGFKSSEVPAEQLNLFNNPDGTKE